MTDGQVFAVILCAIVFVVTLSYAARQVCRSLDTLREETRRIRKSLDELSATIFGVSVAKTNFRPPVGSGGDDEANE